MKIIQALKELPVLEKRIQKQTEEIGKYASYASNIGPEFSSPEEQRQQVKSLVQSNSDLARRYMRIRAVLAKTNATVEVAIEGEKFTINEWITYRQKMGAMLSSTYARLTRDKGASELRAKGVNVEAGEPVQVIALYDEKEKREKLQHIDLVLGEIDAALEMVNATTDLIEEI